MNDLPNGWRRVALADLGEWYGGGTPSKARADFWTNGTVPWLSPKDMGVEVLKSTKDLITESAITGSAVRRLPAGSVALVVRSGILERTLPIAVVPFSVTLNQDMKAVVPRSDIDARWIAWGLRSRERDLLAQCRKAGTTVASIETSRLLEQELLVPPLDEQRSIVEILEGHLSRLDSAQESLRIAESRAATLIAAHRSRLFRALGDSPSRCRQLLEVATIANGQTPKDLKVHAVAKETAGAVPFFKVGDMNASDGRWMESARTYLEAATVRQLGLAVRPLGTVLIPKRGGAIATNKKRLLAKPGCYDLNTMGLVPGPELHAEFLWHWFQGLDLGRLADGSNVPQINAPQIRALRLPVPPLDVQAEASQQLDVIAEATHQLVASMPGRRAQALRSSLLAAAFSGRLNRSDRDVEVLEVARD